MSILHLPYGNTTLPMQLQAPYDLFIPRAEVIPANPAQIILQSLNHPVGDCRLEFFRGAKTASITVNDKTRPVPYQHLLPPLLNRLNEIGIADQNITLIIATGTHAPANSREIEQILPASVLSRPEIEIVPHNCDDPAKLVYLGLTTRGTPVWVNKMYHNSDLRIVTGTIEPHHFMGFSGGVKSAAIGLAGRETINKNHAMLGDPFSVIGEFERNPMRQDVEEIGRLIGVHFALNVLINSNHEILDVLSGDPLEVMRAGIDRAQKLWFTAINSPYDLVIASAGGHPKDINLYQAQKAISHAALFAKPGGEILLVAACPEGIGSAHAEQFARTVHDPTQAIDQFSRSGFKIGPHKVYQVALQSMRNKIFLVSELAPDVVSRFFLIPVNDLSSGLQAALDNASANSRIAVLPFATATIPILKV
ncbi:MAG: nickel-dependent lactate racemase [Bellilinea sp.]|jgi:nickel-dependent lactate racemase